MARRIAAAALLAAMTASPGWAQTPRSITRAEAVAEALAHNPQILASRAQLSEARATLVQLTAFPDPQFYFDAEQQSSILRPRSATSRDIGGTLTLPFPDKFALNNRIGKEGIRAAEENLRLTQQQIASSTVQACDALLVAERHRDDLKEAEQLAEDFLQKTQARFDAGTVARLDVLTAKVSLAQAKNDLIGNERTLLTAHASLNHLLGRSAGDPLELSEKLATPPLLPGLPAIEALAMESRPELRSLAAQRLAARASTKLASQFWLPDLSVTISRNLTVGSPPAYSTILAFDVPVFFWQHTNGDVAQARSKEEELAANATDQRLQVEVDVRTSFAAADTALRQVHFLEEELLPESQEQYRIASESYSLGGSSAVDVLQARQALLSAQQQLTDALGAASDALADLERAAGAPLPPAPTNSPQGDSHEK